MLRRMPSLELSPDAFAALAADVARLARDWLAGLDARPIAPQVSGADLAARLGGPAPEEGIGAAVVERLAEVAAGARAQNGRFLGYVLGSGEPVGAAADLLASVLNQNVTAWRSAPSGVTLERTVIGWLASAVGCAGFAGSLV